MSDASTLPVPYKGKNTRDPVAVISAPECADILNFNPEVGGVSIRNGDDLALSVGGIGPTIKALRLVPYGDTVLYEVYSGAGNTYFVDISTGLPVNTIATSGDTDLAYLYFNKYLFFMGNNNLIPGAGGTPYYNGAAWGLAGYTFASGIIPFGGAVFNHRAYFLGYGTSIYNYTPVDAITGTCFAVDLSSLISSSSILAAIGKVTIGRLTSTTVYLAFIFFSGEILFFEGTYPDDPDNWSITGTAKIGTPINYSSTIEYSGDTLVITDTGLYSLRDVFLSQVRQQDVQGVQTTALNLTLSNQIDPSWRALVAAYRAAIGPTFGPIIPVRGVWDRINNRIIISFPGYLDSAGAYHTGSYYFILDTLQLGWFPHRSFGLESGSTIIDINRSNNKIYIFGNKDTGNGINVWIKEGAIDYQDDAVIASVVGKIGYDFLIESAPVPFPKTEVYQAGGLEIILESDQYSVTNYAFIGDFGGVTTASQPIADQGTGVAKPLANIGMEATFVQAKISGTTKSGTIGTTYYNFNVWYDKGEKGSR